jgi:pimeloyl-ACP methyl ester carboxylesterase
MTPDSHFYLSQRLRLHYVDWGNPDAPPLVLLHGARDHCRNWDWLAARLSKHWHVIAPDLRGHGDSQWSLDGHYGMEAYVYDLFRLVEEQQLAPLRLVGHSLGGNICLRYTGIYPDMIHKVVAIEGIGPSPVAIAQEAQLTIAERLQKWFAEQSDMSARTVRRYPTIEAAAQRMQQANQHLSMEQAQHLTQHGVRRNDDGSYSWKFDPYLNSWSPVDITREQIGTLWARITCPTLMIYGNDSWASNPAEDGRIKQFPTATLATVAQAGHWVHHDQPSKVLTLLQDFLTQ